MTLFIRLSTLAAILVLVRCVPATVVITAPSSVIDNTGGLETREQGPTAWICSVLAVSSPWTSYANIRGYLEGGNAEKKNFSNLVLYPVMELFHASESRLCVYLPAEDHCYPPAPSTSQVKAVKQLSKRNYYAIRFWGQASDARVQYYKQKLMAALNTQSKAANLDLFFVSYFSDHVREARFDLAPTVRRTGADPLIEIPEQRSNTCPTAPGYSIASTTTQVAGQEYLRTTLLGSRLNMSDVQTTVVPRTDVQSQDACARAASSAGRKAFSFVSGVCKVYDFDKPFCPCAPGDFEIYINKKLLGESKELMSSKPVAGVKPMVIYTEIPLDLFSAHLVSLGSGGDKSQCAESLSTTQNPGSGAFIKNDECYLSTHHDFPNCNRTCRGQPVDILFKDVNLFPMLPILSLCGQKIIVPVIDSVKPLIYYISHAGFGCYPYEGAMTSGGEDCIVTFEKVAGAKWLTLYNVIINLNSEGSTCLDVLSIYNGTTAAEASLQYRGCSEPTGFSTGGSITIKFHRGLGSEKNFGFKLMTYASL